MDMQFGLSKSGNCLILEISRTLDENIKLNYTIERLCDNSSNMYDEEEVNKNVNVDKQILPILNTFIKLVCDVESKIDDTVLFSKVEYNKEIRKIKLNEIEVQLKKYKNLIQELLRDYEQNYISQSDYTDFNGKYMLQINQLNIEKEELLKNKINSYNLEWMKQFKKKGVIKEIDRNIVDCFINNIYVNNDKMVNINLKFKREYENTLRYLKNK